jgi:uncharacterized delta-60 repeat protein
MTSFGRRALAALVLAACGANGSADRPATGEGPFHPPPPSPVTTPDGGTSRPPDAAPGAIDASFGSGGVARIARQIMPAAVLVQADGRIVVAGETYTEANTFDAVAEDTAVLRLTADGALDTSFGTGGVTQVHLGKLPGIDGRNYVRSLTAMPDGKLLVVCDVSSFNGGIGVLRLGADGRPDASFGTDGGAVVSAGRTFSVLGAPIASGATLVVGVHQNDSMLARVDASGALDASFGQGGTKTIADTTLTELLISPTGEAFGHGLTGGQLAFVRIDAGGAMSVVAPSGSFSILGPTPDGRALVIDTDATTERSTLKKVGSDGSLDPSFAADFDPQGQHIMVANRAAWQADGKLLFMTALGQFVESSGVGTPSASQPVLVRYTTKGVVDSAFGAGGRVSPDLGSKLAFGGAIALAPDGRIVVAGTNAGADTTIHDFVVARYWP